MADYLELLKKVLIKPSVTYNTGTDNMWNNFEREERIVFPQDYKEIINYYGTGGIGNFIWLLTPFDNDKNVNFVHKMYLMLDSYKESKSKFPEDFKYNIFPEKKGLLPWGYTDNGDELYWETDDNFENWKVVIYESRSANYFYYEMGLSEFLYKLICNQINCDIFPDNISKGNIKYDAVNTNE